MVIGILKQILLGIGIAAGQALVETGQQLTVQTLQAQMAKMGVDLDPNSPLGMLLDNFKSNLGFQLSYELMRVSDNIMDFQIEKLRENSRKNKELISKSVRDKCSQGMNLVNTKILPFFKHPFDSVAYTNECINTEVSRLNNEEDRMLSNRIDAFYKVRQSTGSMYQGLAIGSGVNNQAFNSLGTGIADDTKFFDSVQYLINMKKVG